MSVDVESLQYVPWYIPLLVEAALQSLNSDGPDVAMRKRFREILPDVTSQAEAYWAAATYGQRPVTPQFDIHLHGGLDLFGTTGVCRAFPCRIAASNRLVRSAGVFADHIWLTDSLTLNLLEFGRSTNERVHLLFQDAVILASIYPLIEAGIIRFRPPAFFACEPCLNSLEGQVAAAVDLILPIFGEKMAVKMDDNGHRFVDSGSAYDPPLHILFSREAKDSDDQLIRYMLRDDLRSALFIAQEIHLLGGSIFSNSKVSLAGMLSLSRSDSSRRSIRKAMVDDESIEFPWVSELNAAQIVELREEAATALPRFREMMATMLAAKADGTHSENARARIDELRERSEALRVELLNVCRSSQRFWRTTAVMLGVAASAYGIAANQPAAAISGLVPIIQNMLSHKVGAVNDQNVLTSDPAFLLVKARDLLSHA